MSPFDFDKYRLHLAQKRTEDLDLSFADIIFSPGKHPRGPGGRFAFSSSDEKQLRKKITGLKVGESHEPEPGVRITKDKASADDHTKAMGFRIENAFPLMADHADSDYEKAAPQSGPQGLVARGLSADQVVQKIKRRGKP